MSSPRSQQGQSATQGNGAGELPADQEGRAFDPEVTVVELPGVASTSLSSANDALSHAAGDARTSESSAARAGVAIGNYELLGQVVSLLALSPQHRHLFLIDLEWRLGPPTMRGQCRLFRRQGKPFAFVSWAFVTEEIAGRLQAMPGRVRPDEWNCGKQLMLIDIVAPFGGADACVRVVSEIFENGVRGAKGDSSKPPKVS